MSEIKPKILIFSVAYLPLIGGAEIAVQEITKRLGDDFQFDLITARLDKKLSKQEKIGNLSVYRVGDGNKFTKYFFPWTANRLAKKMHKKNNYKIVWGMMATWGGWAALKFKERFPNAKYLLTMQSGDSDEFIKRRTWFWQARYKKIYQTADRIQVISKWLKDRAQKFGYSGEISLVPNGADLDKFKKSDQNLKDKDNQKVILSDSRLVAKNGLEDLIRGFQIYISNLPSDEIVKLKIISHGPMEKELKELADEQGVKDNIEFLGLIEYDKLNNYYQQADVFIRPAHSEGFGNVFVQAMAAEVPVIATPVGGIPDFLQDGVTGWLCEVKNPESIAEKIKYILDQKNKDAIQRVVKTAKKMVEEKYTWDKVAKQMKSIFNDLIR